MLIHAERADFCFYQRKSARFAVCVLSNFGVIPCFDSISTYFNVRMNAITCQICSSVRIPAHGAMDVPGLPVFTRQNR